jgi:hypothetical protein
MYITEVYYHQSARRRDGQEGGTVASYVDIANKVVVHEKGRQAA